MEPDVHRSGIIRVSSVMKFGRQLFARAQAAVHPNQLHQIDDRALQSSFSGFLAASPFITAAISTTGAEGVGTLGAGAAATAGAAPAAGGVAAAGWATGALAAGGAEAVAVAGA